MYSVAIRQVLHTRWDKKLFPMLGQARLRSQRSGESRGGSPSYDFLFFYPDKGEGNWAESDCETGLSRTRVRWSKRLFSTLLELQIEPRPQQMLIQICVPHEADQTLVQLSRDLRFLVDDILLLTGVRWQMVELRHARLDTEE